MKEEEIPIQIIDKREKPAEIQIAELLISKGIYTLEQVEELLEPSFYAVIPISILEKKDISANAKLLYAEIMALSKKSGKCFATNNYLAERLGISERTITRLLKELKNDALIYLDIKQDKEGTFRNITITYIGDRQSVGEGGTQLGDRGIPKLAIQKRNRQREIDNKNDNIATPAVVAEKPPINDLIEFFKPVNPSYERLFGNSTQRDSLERLFKKLGREKLELILKTLPVIFGKPYAPRITTPYVLEQKLGDLAAYLQQEKLKNPKIIEIQKDEAFN